MDSRLFRVSADDISEFFVASNEGDVTYFKNVILTFYFGNTFMLPFG